MKPQSAPPTPRPSEAPAAGAGNEPVTLRLRIAASPLPRLEAHMLWQQVLGVARSWLVAHDTDPLDPACVAAYEVLEARRLAGEPMAYIVGQREFMGRAFRVTPDVLIPRPETECLVDVALDILADRPAPRVLDLGTGSGIVAISIALARPDAQVTATDLSAAALEVAEQNAQALGASLQFLHGNWYDSLLGSSRYDLIVSNPPYIHVQDRHLGLGDLRFEPPMALTDQADGLSALRTIIEGASRYLTSSGAVCVEHGWDQAAAVRELMQCCGFTDIASLRDLAGIERVTRGRLSF